MTLREVLQGIEIKNTLPEELGRKEVTGLEYDSRKVCPGYVFFAFKGHKVDGRQFAGAAVEQGAVAVVSDQPRWKDLDGLWIEVENGRVALALAARNFYRAPDRRLRITGITGTNGKTTSCYLAHSVLEAAGYMAAMIGTIEYRVGGTRREAVNTTPESLDLYRLFAELEQASGTHVTMEVSSHALALGRVYGIHFHTAVFTNLTRDHLDFHGNMENYFAAKCLLFEGQQSEPPRFAAINLDDPYGWKIRTSLQTARLSYAIDSAADVRATGIEMRREGLCFEVQYGEIRIPVRSPLVGRINVYNILAACCVGFSYGLPPEVIKQGIARCESIPGRFERVDEGQPFLVVVDYAHTDDALRNVLRVARELTSGRVITVFGCGGDRDRTKRPLMGEVAGQLSHLVVLTSDNPRSEDPLAIINDAVVGLQRYETPYVTEPDREKAIQRAIREAREGDVVVLAGKGHERYQIVGDRKIPFDDREVAREVLRGFGYRRKSR